MQKKFNTFPFLINLIIISPLVGTCAWYDIECQWKEKIEEPFKENVLKPTGDFFEHTVYEKGLRDTIYEQGIKVGTDSLVNAAQITGNWFDETARTVDYGIPKPH